MSSETAAESAKSDGPRDTAQHPERLRWRRRAAGLKLYEAARRAGISDSSLSRFERGRTSAPPPVLRKLAKVYRCEITDLMPAEPGARESVAAASGPEQAA
jgi:transcriptional regulator with XRE-family HTH domain